MAVGHGREEQVQQHGFTRQMVAMFAQKAAIHPGPARRGRTPQASGNQNAFLECSCLGLLWSKNGIEPLCPKIGGLLGEAINGGPARR